MTGVRLPAAADPVGNFGADVTGLLTDWCDGLLRMQFRDESKPDEFGAFRCPACGMIHGRCPDATYPFLHLAARTGKREYLDAALRVRAWSRNVDCDNGAWQNDPGKEHVWQCITVFGAIALAESLHHHGKLLDTATRAAWIDRLRKATEFVYREFHWNNYAVINYPITASYALTLCGQVLDDARYRDRGREFARKSLGFLTKPSRLLYGEGKPYEQRSANCYKKKQRATMPFWFELFLGFIGSVLVLPLLLIVSTPYILIASFFGDGSYGNKIKAKYRSVIKFWKEWGWGFSL